MWVSEGGSWIRLYRATNVRSRSKNYISIRDVCYPLGDLASECSSKEFEECTAPIERVENAKYSLFQAFLCNQRFGRSNSYPVSDLHFISTQKTDGEPSVSFNN